MIAKVSTWVRAVRRFFSRSEWSIRLLGLSRSKAGSHSRGLVLVQIDGLSHRQFSNAVAEGNLPFLKRLLEKEHYRVHSHYSGMPTNTPAVQAELFYGVKGAVPAFCYRDKKTGRIFKMYDSASAADVERRLEREAAGLLTGGSAYSDVFTGGAEEAHFCAAKLGWGGLFCAKNPLALPLVWLFHIDIFLRTAVLLSVEFFLALIDCVRGTIAGKVFFEELKFIPARVAVCVLLRELVTTGARIDIARGLPVIHLNYLGYDEQSHRRGPTSRFAHWSLRGIDDSIARIWRAAQHSERRHYDLWVYSDHGQESTRPYLKVSGRAIEEAIAEVFGQVVQSASNGKKAGQETHKHFHLFRRDPHEDAPEESAGRLVVAAMGPVGHVYPPRDLDAAEKAPLAEALVKKAGVPMVLMPDGASRASVWTDEGVWHLPADRERLFGADHPFLDEITNDTIALCHHPDAGTFILAGWKKGSPPVSFPQENGSHAGPGPEESHAFALLSSDAPLPDRATEYLRPLHLRQAALNFLGRSADQSFFQKRRLRTGAAKSLKIMTYNVHGCVGMDGKLSPDRIARVIARHDADIVALQELDVGRLRSGGVNQAETIARKLDMIFHFHPTFILEDEKYGNAILSRYPMHLVKMASLPKAHRDLEPRGALWVAIDLGRMKVQFINCHLSIWPHERYLQAETLAGPEWVGNSACSGPVVLCGDFNALPGSPSYKKIASMLRDSQLHLNEHRPHNTWLGRYPLSRIDHVFIGPHMQVTGIKVPTTELDKSASDHLPLVVEIDVPDEKDFSGKNGSSVERSSRAWVIRTDPKTGRRLFEKESREKPRES